MKYKMYISPLHNGKSFYVPFWAWHNQYIKSELYKIVRSCNKKKLKRRSH